MSAQHKPSDIVTVRGRTQSLNEFAAELGGTVQAIISRLNRGKSIEEACTTPISKIGGQNRGQTCDADVLATDDVQQLLHAGRNSETAVRDAAILVIAYRAGLRCFEILALRMKDLDLARGTVTVHHGKGDKHRTVALDAAGWQHVSKWVELRSTWPISDASPLFCTRQGGKLSDRQVRAMIARRARRAGITKRAHVHGLRRTMASEMAAEGVPLIDICGALGHNNVATTNEYLKQINPTSVIDAMKRRGWGGSQLASPSLAMGSAPPAPGWLDRMLADIGPQRLKHFSDARKSDTNFQAVVLLFDA